MTAPSRIVAVIPARGGSKRLLRKNIHPVAGRPMLSWAVEACRRSARIDACYVSTEDPEIAQVARDCGAEVILRPPELAGDQVHKQEVIRQAVRWLEDERGIKPEVVISLQANSPELSAADLDHAIGVFERFDRWELFSVDKDLMQNAAFRIMRREQVFYASLSVHVGVVVCDVRDVHTIEDVAAIEAEGVLQARLREWGQG